LFYSRRIGIQAPSAISNAQLTQNEVLVNEPLPSQLYNASKISGRMKNGLGIGFFNAITAERQGMAFDTILDLNRSVIVSPLTNYNVRESLFQLVKEATLFKLTFCKSILQILSPNNDTTK
jgi:hypothetical protein